MKRPPKKKHKNPLLPDDQQVDERHLVDTEESAEISFEDRAQIYWMENRGFITGCITVLLLLVAGYQGVRIYMNYHSSEVQADYAAAEQGGELAAFADSHSGTPLGAFAALRTAHEAYEAGDFDAALAHYRLAAEGLDDGILSGRARLGEAFALYNNGNKPEGYLVLEAIIADKGLADAVRAEAAYHLAVHAHAEGDDARVESLAARIEGFAMGGQWGQRLETLLR